MDSMEKIMREGMGGQSPNDQMMAMMKMMIA
jgi:hypothetical protein